MPALGAFRLARASGRSSDDLWWVLCLIGGRSRLPRNISEKNLTNSARHATLCDMKTTSAPILPTGNDFTAPRLASVRQATTREHSLRGGSADFSLEGQSKNFPYVASKLVFLAQPAQFEGVLFSGRVCCSVSHVRLANGAMHVFLGLRSEVL